MTTFDDRLKSFEEKYKHDQELQFKVSARRNKLLGLWAADKIGLDQSEADIYAKEVIKSDFDRPGDDDVHEKVLEDFEKSNVDISAHQLRKEMDRLMQEATKQIMEEVYSD